jgi:hypothetical protein
VTAAGPSRTATAAGPQRAPGDDQPGAAPDDGDALAALRALPSIGPRLAEKLLLLGVRSPAGLRGRDPEALYDELQAQLGPVDRCVLYAFRCAVYAADHGAGHDTEHDAHPGSDRGGGHGADDPELAKWWNWKDGGPALRRTQTAGD